MAGQTWGSHRPVAGRRGEAGNAAIEAVILYPVVLALVMWVFQAAIYYHARDVARSAANGGAVVGAVLDGSPAEAQAEAQSRIEQAGSTSLLETSTVTATRDGTRLTVTVTGRAMTFVPFLPDLTVEQTVVAPVERFTAP